MNTIKKLGALAALAVLSSSALQAVTIDLTVWSPTPTNGTGNAAYTDSRGNGYYAYYLNGSSSWVATNWQGVNGSGLGVNPFAGGGGMPAYIDQYSPGYTEYMVIDFGANYTGKSSFELKLTQLVAGNFTYHWSSVFPSGSTPTAGSVATNSTPITAGTFVALTALPTDRYLYIGAASPFGASFAIAGVQYNQVPDGSLTVTLLGTALGGLGIVGFRRRKA